MTINAIDYGGIYVEMGLLELTARFMAFAAQGVKRLIHQLCLIGKMGFMTSQAIPGGRRMDSFGIHFFLDVLVTGEAKFRARRHKQGLQL